MKKLVRALAAVACAAAASRTLATPSTVFWTPATPYTQPVLVPHLTYDTYVAEQGMLANDYGLTVGILPLEKLQGEIGLDVFYSGYTADWIQLNGKLTLPENAFGGWSPGLSVGIMNAGFKTGVSDYDLLYGTIGKTTPVGALAVGGYYGAGSTSLWTNSDGKEVRGGFMASWTSPDIVLDLPGLQKIVFMADGASGKNWFGAAGAAIGLYFTPAIDVLTGPVFFVDRTYYRDTYGPDWMWSVQLDVDVDLRKKR
jgi:hypothetical protein